MDAGTCPVVRQPARSTPPSKRRRFGSLRLMTVAVAVGFVSLAGARVDARNRACTTASDCHTTLLPKICMRCDDGLERCAQWACAEGKCTIRMCEPVQPYDFTGHWGGSETTSGGGETLALSADLTSTSAKVFTGTMTAGGGTSCTAKGRRTKKVKAHLHCTDGSKITLTGQLDTTSQTITGTFTRAKHGKGRKGGTFTLTKTLA